MMMMTFIEVKGHQRSNVLNYVLWLFNLKFKEVDRGSAIVIMDTTDYLNECHRQLNDTKYYKPVKKDPTAKFVREVTEVVREAYTSGVIADDMRTVVTPNQPKRGRFYILPKLHKTHLKLSQ